MRTLSLSAVWNLRESVINSILVSVSPVWTIFCATLKSFVKVILLVLKLAISWLFAHISKWPSPSCAIPVSVSPIHKKWSTVSNIVPEVLGWAFIPILPLASMRSLSLPAVSNVIVLVANSILVSASPVWTIFCETFRLPVNDPVPQAIFGVPVKPSASAAVPVVSWLPEEFTPGRSIFADPSNDTPPIFLAVASVVAVSALPVTSPVRSPVNDVATAVPVILMPVSVVASFSELL